MKRKLLVLLVAAFVLLSFTFTSTYALSNVPVKSIALDDMQLGLNVGKTAAITYTVYPYNAANKVVKWSSSNAKVAKVSAKGVVTAVSVGSAVITCKSADKKVKTDCRVDVVKGVTTLKLFVPAIRIGEAKNTYLANILRDRLSISLNVIASVDGYEEKLQAMMAGGELPDIIQIPMGAKPYPITAIKGGLVKDLTPYLDKLPNPVRLSSKAINYYKKFLGTGDKTYALPCGVGNPDEIRYMKGDLGENIPWVDWASYKKIGMPKINKLEDFLTVLKKMQNVYPKNKDGQKTYGISIFSDWDVSGGMLFAGEIALSMGVYTAPYMTLPMTEVNHAKNGETKSVFASDSMYLRMLKFFYNANKLGIFDPESNTQTFGNMLGKRDADRVLFGIKNWLMDCDFQKGNMDPPIGARPILAGDTVSVLNYDIRDIKGNGQLLFIGNGCKHINEALRFLNYFFTTQSYRQIYYGMRGVVWDMDSKGNPYLTKFGKKAIRDNTADQPVMPGGGKIGQDGQSVINLAPFTPQFSYEGTDYTTAAPTDFWPAEINNKDQNQNALMKDYAATTGITDFAATLVKTKHYCNAARWTNFCDPAPTDIVDINSSIIKKLITASWKMVYAKDEAEFNGFWSQLCKDAEGLGLSKLNDWGDTQINKAKDKVSQYFSD